MTCFPEPSTGNDRSAWMPDPDWFDHSTSARAQRMRTFLNDALDGFPAEAAAKLCPDLRSTSFRQAWFELIVGRWLQAAGGRLEYEPAGENGATVDWRATFPDGDVACVEATSPRFRKVSDARRAATAELRHIVERESAGRGWSLLIRKLPPRAPQDRLIEFRRVVRGMLDELPDARQSDADLANPLHLVASTVRGQIELDCWPQTRRPDGGIDARTVTMNLEDDPAHVIAMAIRRKRLQGRAFAGRVLVAIDCPPDGPDRDDFDAGVCVASGELVIQRRPEFLGVLAFLGVRWMGGEDPTLYPHPLAMGDVPAALRGLARRTFDGRSVTASPATGEPIMSRVQLPA